jgi:hypothetical protein
MYVISSFNRTHKQLISASLWICIIRTERLSVIALPPTVNPIEVSGLWGSHTPAKKWEPRLDVTCVGLVPADIELASFHEC